MIAVGPNFFYTVTLPCTLWFLDKGKKKTDRKDKILFIDASKIFNQIDRAHREFLPEQIEFITNIVRLYRGENIEYSQGSKEIMKKSFPKDKYQDIAGLCRVATIKQIEDQGWSLNSGRYVGVVEKINDDVNFRDCLENLNKEFQILNTQSAKLEQRIVHNIERILER
jgi:type I restriction enzyme M protein